jgi:hypothetical protein
MFYVYVLRSQLDKKFSQVSHLTLKGGLKSMQMDFLLQRNIEGLLI